MTKEQAIEVLRCNTNLGYGIVIENESTQLIKEAIEMAIKSLEQQLSEDCVSRQAVLDCLTATGLKKFDFILDAREKVNNLPPVTPTHKVGKWICVHHLENKITYDSWKCSECQHDFNSEEESTVDFDEYKFCPNCGAKMINTERGEE